MKNIKTAEIKRILKNLLVKASFELPDDILEAVKTAKISETSQHAKTILDMIIKNAEVARCNNLPLCQDCGTVYINMEAGPDICILSDDDFSQNNNNAVQGINAGPNDIGRQNTNSGQKNVTENLSYAPAGSVVSKKDFLKQDNSNILKSINEAVSETYKENYLRMSTLSDPLYDRKNTMDNLPAIINISFSDKSGLHIEVNLKGGGSENCSWLLMLNPSSGEDTITDEVLRLVRSAVTRACPPVIIGLGIGSTASEVTKLARKAAFRNLRIRNSDKRYARLENSILEAVNNTGIGPQGIGGKTTALACNIEFAPCHMATLPFSVFFGCHSTRRAEAHLAD